MAKKTKRWLVLPPAMKELRSSSDRTVAVVAGALVSSYLVEAIKCSMCVRDNELERKLFEEQLGSFASQIDLAYLLGLVSADLRTELHVIRTIRNLFAHELGRLSFNTRTVKQYCIALRAAKTLGDTRKARERFLFATRVSLVRISSAIRKTRQTPRAAVFPRW